MAKARIRTPKSDRSVKPFAPRKTHILGAAPEVVRPRRRRASRDSEEAREQKRWVRWARERGLEIQHQNNGASSKRRRIHLHAMGCTAGAADVLVFDRLPKKPELRGLALEFKASVGEQSKEQEAWQRRLERMGWAYHVVRSKEAAVEVCEWYGL